MNVDAYMDCWESNIEQGGQEGRTDDKQRPKHTKIINLPMSITETHFLSPCRVNFPRRFFDDCSSFNLFLWKTHI